MSVEVSPAVEVARMMETAFRRGDWDGLRACYHDEARLCTVSSESTVLGADETVELLRSQTKRIFDLGPDVAYVAIDDNACVVEGRLRYQHPRGGLADSSVCWLQTFKGGLLYRSRVFYSRSEAVREYHESGVTVGIDK